MRPRKHPPSTLRFFIPSARARRVYGRTGLIALGALAALLVLPQLGPAEDDGATVRSTAHSPEIHGAPAPEAATSVREDDLARNVLQPGQVLVLASWVCPYPRLDEVNEVALSIVEPPLTALTENGELVGWGQLNGEFRDEYNYHTYYIAENMEGYRRAIGQVLSYMNREVPGQMNAFYELCSRTRETRVTVVTAQP